MIPTLSDALAERGYDRLTDVQQAVTAPELAEADLLVSAQTGSGKTVGFGLAIAPTLMGDEARLGPPAAPLALIIAPTRELALQVQRELAWLYGKAGARVVSCIGGMDARDERRALDRGAHIVVGTPGRLRDHLTRGALALDDIRVVVLDEADEMLDLGFREDLEFMLGEAPEDRRTLMFSATVSKSITEIAKKYQHDAQRVTTLTGGSQHSDIGYQVVQVAPRDTENAIINLLRFHDAQTAIVFANTRAAVARLTARFANRGFSVVSLSGELSQDERSHALQALRDGRASVCVATDVAARGIDLPNLELVIHADRPTNTEALLHRSGRTGRAGRKGTSVLIVPDKIAKKATRLLKWAKIEAEWIYPPTPYQILARDEERLLADTAWEQELTEGEQAFAAKLMELHGPEKIAAACLRLYRGKLSAPEILNAKPGPRDPQDRKERRDHQDFGPSVWFSLSVGRENRAEARWLLPLLCRTGNLEKTQIGKIRVQETETYVEIAEAAAEGLVNHIGAEGLLEDDIHATRLDELPQEALRPPPRFDKKREDRRGPKPDWKKSDRPYSDRPKSGYPKSSPGKRDDAASEGYRSDAPRKPRQKKDWDAPKDHAPKDQASREKAYDKADSKARKSGGNDEGKGSDRPAKGKTKAVWSDAPRSKDTRGAKPKRDGWAKDRPAYREDRGDAPRKPKGKFGDRPGQGKPSRGKPGQGKPGQGKSGPGKFASGKPAKSKPGQDRGDAPRRKPGAADTSQRMDRPKGKGGKAPAGKGPNKSGFKSDGKAGARPKGKFVGRGGDATPRRRG
jgi:ATP-dependent RNA helicase DeaD